MDSACSAERAWTCTVCSPCYVSSHTEPALDYALSPTSSRRAPDISPVRAPRAAERDRRDCVRSARASGAASEDEQVPAIHKLDIALVLGDRVIKPREAGLDLVARHVLEGRDRAGTEALRPCRHRLDATPFDAPVGGFSQAGGSKQIYRDRRRSSAASPLPGPIRRPSGGHADCASHRILRLHYTRSASRRVQVPAQAEACVSNIAIRTASQHAPPCSLSGRVLTVTAR
jgi:hypothetical protein